MPRCAFQPANFGLAYYQFRLFSRSQQLPISLFRGAALAAQSQDGSPGILPLAQQVLSVLMYSLLFDFVLVFLAGKILLFATSIVLFCILYSLDLA